MKKLIVYLILLIFIAICSFGVSDNMFNFDCNMQVFVTDLSSSFSGKFSKNGNGYVVYTNKNNYKEVLKNVDGVYGLSFIKKSNLDEFNFIKQNVKILKNQELENIITFYGFFDGGNMFCYIDGKKVNIQVSYNMLSKDLTIGFPIILGSY